MDLGLSGKRVLVTGGSSGIGAAVSQAFAGEGARVAINYFGSAEAANRMCADFARAGGSALALQADVSNAAQVQAMFAEIDRHWDGVDILIANAGMDGVRALGWESEPGAWMRVIEVNLKGAYLCAREALRRMVPAKAGVIINTSSVHEVIAWTGYSAYVASKAGLSMMAKTLAQEAAPFGVRVLSVAPGAVRTDINRPVWEDPVTYKDLIAKIPLNRIGEPADIARMVTVLASDVSSYITATTIFIDGGMTDYPDFARGG
jgi:NAD(P)-dependent dehydrogenase (short-subunit alcohol dehydrogenase family)